MTTTQLTLALYADCVPQWIRINDTNADGATAYFNVTSEDACLDRCLQDLRCVAVDVSRATNPLSCWPHFKQADILHTNLYSQRGTSLLIPVKRCIASLYCKQFYSWFLRDPFQDQGVPKAPRPRCRKRQGAEAGREYLLLCRPEDLEERRKLPQQSLHGRIPSRKRFGCFLTVRQRQSLQNLY